MPEATLSVAAILDSAAALAYLALAFHLGRRAAARPRHGLLATAALATALWAGLSAGQGVAQGGGWAPAAAVGQAVASLAWLAVLASLLQPVARWRWSGLVLLALGSAVASALPGGSWLADWWRGGALPILGSLGLSLLGLVLVENVVRSTAAGGLWSTKFLCLGIGGIFAYDFFVYSKAALFWQTDADLLQARGAVHLILVPALAVGAGRQPALRSGIALSHRLVLHSAALVGAGCYLMLMGAAGFYVREFGGSWGPMLQAAFLFGSLVLLAGLLVSGRFRALVRVLIAKHFFAYRYDYREEWLRFLATMAAGDAGAGMRQRLIAAIANVVDSPGGALWLRGDAGAHHLVATWNHARAGLAEQVSSDAAAVLDQGRIVELGGAAEPTEAAAPAELASSGLWLLVPLMHRDGPLGFLGLEPARAPRRLDWEDYDLLRTLGREAASHLSEHEAMQALADARQLELFNRRFAFVIHDLKTIIAQMSLLLANADRHGGNPAFQRDMVVSVGESVASMRQLLAQIDAERGKAEILNVTALAQAAVQRLPPRPPVSVEAAGAVEAAVDSGKLKAVLAHLLDNAREAAGPHGHVVVRVAAEAGGAVVEIEDDGPGMDGAFVRDQLFRPFTSTKREGFGIGAYQCRELVRELGGQLIVDSAPGQGTTMRVRLPAARGPAVEAEAPSALALLAQRKVV